MKEHFNIRVRNSEMRIYVHPKYKEKLNKVGNIISDARKAGSKQAIEAFSVETHATALSQIVKSLYCYPKILVALKRCLGI